MLTHGDFTGKRKCVSLPPKGQKRTSNRMQSFPKTTSGTHRYKYQVFSVSRKRGKKDVSSEKVAFVDYKNGGVAEVFTDDII